MNIMTIRSIAILPFSFGVTVAITHFHLPEILLLFVLMGVPIIFAILDRHKIISNDPLVKASSFNFYSAAIFWPAGIGAALLCAGVNTETSANILFIWAWAVSFFVPLAVYTLIAGIFIQNNLKVG